MKKDYQQRIELALKLSNLILKIGSYFLFYVTRDTTNLTLVFEDIDRGSSRYTKQWGHYGADGKLTDTGTILNTGATRNMAFLRNLAGIYKDESIRMGLLPKPWFRRRKIRFVSGIHSL